MITRYFAYVMHEAIPAFEEAGWTHPRTAVSYPRLEEHGTTMEWRGDGDPPIPDPSERFDEKQ